MEAIKVIGKDKSWRGGFEKYVRMLQEASS